MDLASRRGGEDVSGCAGAEEVPLGADASFEKNTSALVRPSPFSSLLGAHFFLLKDLQYLEDVGTNGRVT